MDISHYQQRVKLPHYNGPVSVFTAVSRRDSAKVLLRIMPSMSVDEHQARADQFLAEHLRAKAAYAAALDGAFKKHYGRAPGILDYKVSCIWDEALPESDKDLLRKHGYSKGLYHRIAEAHTEACGVLRRQRSKRPKVAA